LFQLLALRLLPVMLVTVAAGLWFNEVQGGGPYVLRNLIPPTMVLLLSGITLWRGKGRWTGSGWRMPLGTVGFAIPALGLVIYLHYAFSVNLNGMFGGSADPGQLFRFLPFYTTFAGGIGFAIGWIVGRNL
jgi:hypothetical protein